MAHRKKVVRELFRQRGGEGRRGSPACAGPGISPPGTAGLKTMGTDKSMAVQLQSCLHFPSPYMARKALGGLMWFRREGTETYNQREALVTGRFMVRTKWIPGFSRWGLHRSLAW